LQLKLLGLILPLTNEFHKKERRKSPCKLKKTYHRQLRM